MDLRQSKLNSDIAQLNLSNSNDDVMILINRWVILDNQDCADTRWVLRWVDTLYKKKGKDEWEDELESVQKQLCQQGFPDVAEVHSIV